ncbi:MAG: STAS/SEC14 domain-containing protein [Pseudoxanthomonas sp.]
MANHIIQLDGEDFVRARISGRMSFVDQKALESLAVKMVDAGRPVRVLLTLEDFQGWEKDERWGDDFDFTFEYGDRIEAIAIVGEEGWRQQALLFVGKGFRRTRIEYFPPDAAGLAEDWVGVS